MKNYFKHLKLLRYLLILILIPFVIAAQSTFHRDTLLNTARNTINSVPYCTLVSIDTTGHPAARTMDPFPPEKDMVIWLGTNRNSRKVQQIKKETRVSLFYEAPDNSGYVLIKGNAQIVDDPDKKKVYWKEEWDQFYPNQRENYTLIKVIPFKLEIIDYRKNIVGDSETWSVPCVDFNTDQTK